MIDSSAVGPAARPPNAKEERNQADGHSQSGRTTKTHALTDRQGRPIAFMLTGGQVVDCSVGATLLAELPAARMLHGDKGAACPRA